MPAVFTFDQNRSEADWEVFLFGSILDAPRALTVANGTGLDSVTVENGDVTLTFFSEASNLSVAGSVLTGGTVSGITLQHAGENVFRLTGISVDASAVATLLSEGADTGRDDNFQAVFASEATTFNGPSTGAISAFGSVFADTYNLGGDQGAFNYLWTNGGDDSVFGSDGEDYIDNTTATEGLTIDYTLGTVVTTAGGTPVGHFDSNVEDLSGSNFADIFIGNDSYNYMFGAGGDDSFDGGGGEDYFEPGAGDDTVNGGGGADKISYRHDGEATHGIVLKYAGGSGRSGTVQDGFGGTDTFTGIERVAGGEHNDKLVGNNADDNFEGEGGRDTIKAGKGDDYLNGGDGNDKLDGGDGNDFFEGGAGKDKYAGGGGQNQDGNDYWDKVSFEREDGGQGIVVTYAGGGTATVVDTYGNTENATGIEQFKGSRYDDSFIGTADDESAEGMDGADTFDMGGGWDEVQYQNEQDGGSSHGVIANLSGAKISANIGFGKIAVKSGRALDTFGKMDKLIGVERVDGSDLDDYLAGSNGSNGLGGNDGNDRILGNGGEDFMSGGGGNDTIVGGKGEDHMDGETGKDKLTGGRGEDDFNFNHMGPKNADTITDFTSGEDQIWLWDGTFGLGSGELLADDQFLAAAGATEATEASHRVIYNTDNGKLYFDRDGTDGDDAVLFAILKGGVELHASDIQLG